MNALAKFMKDQGIDEEVSYALAQGYGQHLPDPDFYKARRHRQNLALRGYDTYEPQQQQPVNALFPIMSGDTQASFLRSEKDTRPYAETYQRGFSAPGGVSGYNNAPVTSNSEYRYMAPTLAGGSAWGFLSDLMNGKPVTDQEIKDAAGDAAGAAMTGSLAASGVRPKVQAPAPEPQSFPFYRGSSGDRNIGQPARGIGSLNSGALFGTTSPEVASSYALAHGDMPGARPRVFAGEARFANPQIIDAAGADIFNIPTGNGTTSIWDAVKAARKSGNDGLVVNNLVDNPQFSEGPASTVIAATQRGTVFDRNGNLVFANAPTAAAAPSLQHIAKTAAQEVPGIRAYHGSPHDFDKFDLSKIGTGEGAQAYGHGLYFAESPSVAETYKTSHRAADIFTVAEARAKEALRAAGVSVHSEDALDHTAKAVARAAIHNHDKNAGILDTMVRLNPGLDVLGPERTAKMISDVRAPGFPPENLGRMYEVNIKADPADFLDWDRPLSQQSPNVMDAFKAVGRSDLLDEVTPYTARDALEKLGTRRLKDGQPSHEMMNEASAALREAGIPGIKYLDQGSRGAGEGSRNYVVFDDSLVEILRKYGLAGLSMLGGAAAMGNDAKAEQPAPLRFLLPRP